MNDFNQNNTGFPQYHTHNSADGTPYLDEELSIINTRKFIIYRCVGDLVNTSVTNNVGGYIVMPFSGYILNGGIGATVDTAGTTSSTTIDINKNGSTILSTKITIETTETDSRNSATQPVLIPNMVKFSVGDKFSFDIDTISSTPAKGLSVFMNVVRANL